MQEEPQQIIKELHNIGTNYSTREVFEDLCCLMAASYHNSLYTIGGYECPAHYRGQFDKLEAEYATICKKYSAEDLDKLCGILATLYASLQKEPADILGKIYMDLGIGNASRGQYFTPIHIAHMMAIISSSKESIENDIKEQGYTSFCDDACGSGVMATGFIKAVKYDFKIGEYIPRIYIRLTDIDLLCVKMAFVQMCLLKVKARVIWGNTLTREVFGIYDTPALQAECIREPVALDTKEKEQLTLF